MLKDANAEIEFGIWDEKNGYIIRIIGNDLFFVRRTNSGESPQNHGALSVHDFTITDANSLYNGSRYRVLPNDPSVLEEIIPRSSFNGDKLDGAGNSVHTLSLSNVTMFRIQMGWYGFCCSFDGIRAQRRELGLWRSRQASSLGHYSQLNTCDRIPFPSLGNPNLP